MFQTRFMSSQQLTRKGRLKAIFAEGLRGMSRWVHFHPKGILDFKGRLQAACVGTTQVSNGSRGAHQPMALMRVEDR
jgi:hypothetical protein